MGFGKKNVSFEINGKKYTLPIFTTETTEEEVKEEKITQTTEPKKSVETTVEAEINPDKKIQAAAREAADIQPFIPNISKEEDNMHYTCDDPPKEKDKPVKKEDPSLKVEGIPDFASGITTSISEKKVIPDFSGLVIKSKKEKSSINLLEESSNINSNKYPFMVDIKNTAEKIGYGIYWKENTAVNGQQFIGGYLTMNGARVPNKSFMIDFGNIYNRILKIFLLKDGFFIEGCNGYPLYGFDRETKTQFFNEQVIFNLLKGGEDAVNQKDACYKGMDKTINSFVDMVSIDSIKNKNIKKAIKDRLFAALKANVFSESIAQSFNRFRIDPESIITASDDSTKVRFVMLNDAPKHFGEVPIQHNTVRMNFTFNNMSIDVL